jgi:uncharacterized protein
VGRNPPRFQGGPLEPISLEQAREYYSEADPAHDFDHILRVWALAERIGAAEGADLGILKPAVLLHDVGRPEELSEGTCHAAAGAEKAREILSDWPPDKVEAIAHAIASHRFRDDLVPQTLEAKVLFDSDKLDSIGAVGVARAYVIAGLRGQRLWSEVDPQYVQGLTKDKSEARLNSPSNHTPVHEFAFKLSQIKDMLFTTTARRIAEERHGFMDDFFLRLEGEVKGTL